MAKKRKKDKQEAEEYEFTPPEFNEKEFLKKELTDLKVGLITVVFAIALGVAAAAITLANDDLLLLYLAAAHDAYRRRYTCSVAAQAGQ